MGSTILWWRRTALFILAALVFFELPAIAQQEDSRRRLVSTQIEEIVVTARKRDENLQEVPVAVTALGEELLDTTFYRDLQDLEGYAPNVIIDPVTAGPQGIALSIRGISFQDIEKSFDPAIGVFLDDVYIGTNSSALLNNFDLQDLEILRGPQGTLFGKNTTGGALKATRTRPTGEYGARLSFTTGRRDRYDGKAVINFPIFDDKLAGKFFFTSLNDKSSFFNTTRNNRVGGLDFIHTGLTLLYTPVEDLEVLLTYEYIDDKTPTGALINLSQPAGAVASIPDGHVECTVYGECAVETSARESTQNFSDNTKNALHAITMRSDYTLDVGTITSITGWRGNDEEVYQDFDASSIDFFSTKRDQRYDQVSQEVRFASDFSEKFDLIGGLYYWYARYRLDQLTFFLAESALGLPPGTTLSQETTQITHSVAPFLEGNYHILDWLTVTGGLRYTYEYKKIDDFSVATLIPGLPPTFLPGFEDFCAVEGVDCSDSWDEWTPVAGINAQLADVVDIPSNEGALAYFRYARGFKSGGYNGRAATPSSIGPYDPETVDSFELGLKTDWWERRLRFNTTLFWNEYNDKQEEVVQPNELIGQETVVLNAADARTRGVELEATVIPLPGLTFLATFGYLDSGFTNFDVDTDGDGVKDTDLSSLDLRRAPKLNYALFSSYAREIGPGTALASLNWRWTDDFESTAQNYRFGRVRAVGLLDASLGYDLPELHGADWRLTAFGRNITGERYIATALGVANLFAFGAVNNAAIWGLELSTSF